MTPDRNIAGAEISSRGRPGAALLAALAGAATLSMVLVATLSETHSALYAARRAEAAAEARLAVDGALALAAASLQSRHDETTRDRLVWSPTLSASLRIGRVDVEMSARDASGLVDAHNAPPDVRARTPRRYQTRWNGSPALNLAAAPDALLQLLSEDDQTRLAQPRRSDVWLVDARATTPSGATLHRRAALRLVDVRTIGGPIWWIDDAEGAEFGP